MLQFSGLSKKQRDSDSYSPTFTRPHWPEGLGKVNMIHFTLRTQAPPGAEPRSAQTRDVSMVLCFSSGSHQPVFAVVEDVGIKSRLGSHVSSLPGPSSKSASVPLVLVSCYLFFLQVAQINGSRYGMMICIGRWWIFGASICKHDCHSTSHCPIAHLLTSSHVLCLIYLLVAP